MRRPHILYTTFFWHVLSTQIVSCPREKIAPLRKLFLPVSELFSFLGLGFNTVVIKPRAYTNEKTKRDQQE